MNSYTSLNTDIIAILNSSDYGLTLKFYDSEGNVTIDPSETQIVYIKNKNIMISFPTEDSKTISLWKDNKDFDKNFEYIVQRIRELSILNGVSVQINSYNMLNRRELYNIVKNIITTNKEEEMNESKIVAVSNALYEITRIIHNTNKPSDVYISESLKNKNIKSLFENTVNGICSIKGLKEKQIKNLLNKSLIESSRNSIESIVKSFFKQYPLLSEAIYSNVNNIITSSKFVRNQYLNNKPYTETNNVIALTENIKVYPMKTKLDKENLVKAYNHLLSITENAKNGIDILVAIRKNKLCETYSVSKDDLLDMWMSNSSFTPIKPKTLLVFENINGDKQTFNSDMYSSMNILLDHFNTTGLVNDSITKNIVDETNKLNSLTNLIENYMYKPELKKYASTISKLYKECLENLSSNNYKERLSEQASYNFDYSNELNNLELKCGFKHSALKYIAIEEAMQNMQKDYTNLLNEQKNKKLIKEGLMMTLPTLKAKIISNRIVSSGLIAIKELKENKNDKMSLVKSLYENVSSVDTATKNAVKENLFYILMNPQNYNKERKVFVNTLIKYVK